MLQKKPAQHILLESSGFVVSGLVAGSCGPTLWQYGLWSFQTGGTKLERFLPKNQHAQRKFLNFENWVNGEVSKIGRHFRK